MVTNRWFEKLTEHKWTHISSSKLDRFIDYSLARQGLWQSARASGTACDIDLGSDHPSAHASFDLLIKPPEPRTRGKRKRWAAKDKQECNHRVQELLSKS
jgi:hypothetical protein